MKVLIVDDNHEIASIIQRMLDAKGHETMSANNGRSGYFAYLLFRPDVVITDLQMPGGNGLELMKNIRMHDPEIRTIYMSGDLSRFWALLKEEKMRYQAGLLEKPFSEGELMSLLS
jgi:DNA-binding NtrC family response regulator